MRHETNRHKNKRTLGGSQAIYAPFDDYLPGHISEGFREDLNRLTISLAKTEGFKGRYLRDMYESKYMDPKTTPPEVRRRAAIEKWLATESRNASTNQRLQVGEADFRLFTWDKLREKARILIEDILGPLHYPAVLYTGMHTNGASTRVRKSPKGAMDKLTGEAHVSLSASSHWFAATEYTLLEDQTLIEQAQSCLFTVDKSTDIDRVACKEPEINMFLQRAVGNHIRKRLRTFGVDLNDQTKNQRLAQVAVKRDLATIDLSSASDSITRQLVIELLPFEWWSLLEDLRVKETLIDGAFHELEMFSSMGNGFTFELESMLFYAITRGVMYLGGFPGKISVYGDDIIAPSSGVKVLRDVFGFLGFKMNPTKTFWKGRFRESCGCHYYDGVDVSPFFLRRPVASVSALIRTLNQLAEWDGRGWGFIASPEVLAFHKRWAKHVPEDFWGGQDIEASTALVTGHEPRWLISWKSKDIHVEEHARLLFWHASRRNADGSIMNVKEQSAAETWLIVDEHSSDWPYEGVSVRPKRQTKSRKVKTGSPSWFRQTTWAPWLFEEEELKSWWTPIL